MSTPVTSQDFINWLSSLNQAAASNPVTNTNSATQGVKSGIISGYEIAGPGSWGSQTTSVNTSTAIVSTQTSQLGTFTLPFARSIPIVMRANKMKPFAQIYGFVDGQQFNNYIYSCVQLTITNETAGTSTGDVFYGYDSGKTFQSTPDCQLDTYELQGNLQSLYPNGSNSKVNYLNGGEVIRNVGSSSNSYYSAVVIAREVQIDPTTRNQVTVLHVLLPRQWNWNSSWNWGTWSYQSNSVVSNTSFPVGTQIYGLNSGAVATISAVSSPTTMMTNSAGSFYGMLVIPPGTLPVGTHEILLADSSTGDIANSETTAITNYSAFGTLNVYQQNVQTNTNTQINISQNFVFDGDPLAQSFKTPATMQNGCFITSVDIFFAQVSPTETHPVYVEICEMLNGYPTQNVLKNAIGGVAPGNIKTSTDGSVATNIKFLGPVYLAPNTEYCLKVLTNSSSYLVFISQLGQASLSDPTNIIAVQPYTGVLFKSQNNSTWVADETQNLTCNIYQAVFNTTGSGVVTLQNDQNSGSRVTVLPANPFTVLNGSTTCKVYMPNHGLFQAAQIQFFGSNNSTFNSTFSVTSVINSDYFLITLPSAQTTSGSLGGNVVLGLSNIKYDSVYVEIGDYQLPAGTGVTSTMLGSSTSSVDTTETTIDLTQNNNLSASKYIHSPLNEKAFLSGKNSLTINLDISSNDPNVSPVLSLSTLTAKLYSNILNNPTTADNTVVDVQTLTSSASGITFTGTTNIIGIPTTFDITQFKIGAYITISGTTSNNITTEIIDVDKTTSPYKVYVSGTLINESPASTTIVELTGYVDEISPTGGTSESKYQTIPITLAQPATGLQIMFGATIPAGSTIQLYYRTTLSSSNKKITDQKWTSVTMNYTNTTQNNFIDQSYQINALPNFDIAQFKLVLTSTDSTKVPLITDFRAICLA